MDKEWRRLSVEEMISQNGDPQTAFNRLYPDQAEWLQEQNIGYTPRYDEQGYLKLAYVEDGDDALFKLMFPSEVIDSNEGSVSIFNHLDK